MYEPSRSSAPAQRRQGAARVHNSEQAAVPPRGGAHREVLLAAHLTVLLAVMEELARTPGGHAFEEAASRLAERIAELAPAPAVRPAPPRSTRVPDLLALAHDLAARVLVVAASQQDTRSAVLACQVMDATHA